MEPSEQHYDEASTIFSPDGRLYQVEYAREAVKKGATTLGIKWKDGVVLIAHRPEVSHLIRVNSLEKIYQIDDHIACATTGLVADGRHLIEIAREEAQMNRIWYEEPIQVKALVDILCEYKHLYTQFDGVRPFGVVLLIAGIDQNGKHLFSTDPSGAYVGYKAICEGKKGQQAMIHFTRSYTMNLTLNNALDLGLQTLHKVTRKKLDADMVEIAVIDQKKGFHKIPADTMKQLLSKHSEDLTEEE